MPEALLLFTRSGFHMEDAVSRQLLSQTYVMTYPPSQVHKASINVYPSGAHFSDICLLGSDYLDFLLINLNVDYRSRTCTLNPQATPS